MADHDEEIWYQVSDLLGKFRTARSEVAQLPDLRSQLEAVESENIRKARALEAERRADLTKEEWAALQQRIEEHIRAPEGLHIHARIQSIGPGVIELYEELESVLCRLRPRYKGLAPYVEELRSLCSFSKPRIECNDSAIYGDVHGVWWEPTTTNLDRISGLLQDMLGTSDTERSGDFSSPQSAFEPPPPASTPQPGPTAAQNQTLSGTATAGTTAADADRLPAPFEGILADTAQTISPGAPCAIFTSLETTVDTPSISASVPESVNEENEHAGVGLAPISREARLQAFVAAHASYTLADIRYSADVYKPEFRSWKSGKLPDTSVISRRLEDLLAGRRALQKRPRQPRED
jgi:hypothetical protein